MYIKGTLTNLAYWRPSIAKLLSRTLLCAPCSYYDTSGIIELRYWSPDTKKLMGVGKILGVRFDRKYLSLQETDARLAKVKKGGSSHPLVTPMALRIQLSTCMWSALNTCLCTRLCFRHIYSNTHSSLTLPHFCLRLLAHYAYKHPIYKNQPRPAGLHIHLP